MSNDQPGQEQPDLGKTKGVRRFFSDTLWSVAGLVFMNVAAQFAVYPVWSRRLGSEAYGSILFLISIINIVAVSMGGACNYGRIEASAHGPTANAGYLKLMTAATALIVPVCTAWLWLGKAVGSPLEGALYILLMVATLWRYYADVEYRLSLNYRGYFLYYAAVAMGYLAGVGLFLATGLWPLALLPGELAGLAMVLWKGRILRWDGKLSADAQKTIRGVVLTLLYANLLSNVIFNADRLVLKLFIDGAAVSVYYLASLLGKTMALIVLPLNSVLMGYLARYQGRLTVRMMGRIAGGAVLATVAGTLLCTVGSHILISLLYSREDYLLSAPYFIIANVAQVMFFLSQILTSVLLRFAKTRFQVYVNGAYAAAFIALCIPAAILGGVDLFCWAMLATCLIRLAVALGLGFYQAARAEA